ncbi:hypothetical protein CF326_g1486 [Tilletia indica]|uniref:Uncharacterized protein n=1 Tax=Tilletia indica TaxID=43049 RepID=A0A177TMR5_9BASI|nr:hypothetical protein CF326_g1486 [Tilletia indica]KAE8255560.1 hypothetical protein A4X13_0g2995 [Tilletia indica]
MDSSATKITPFAFIWRRSDVPHLNLHDRIHWVMQWVFNDPRGELHGGQPATITSASRELVWIARTFGQEPEPIVRTLDEIIAQTRRDDARRARENNVHPIGRAIWGGKGKNRRHSRPALSETSTPTTIGEDRDGAKDDSTTCSRSSSAEVSDCLPSIPSERDVVRTWDGVSLQTMRDTRKFWNQQYVHNNTDSEDSVD